MQHLVANYPELAAVAKLFLPKYQLLLPGFHRIQLNQQVSLTLIIGDGYSTLPQLTRPADAWFLTGDNFSHNLEINPQGMLTEIARLTKLATSFVMLSPTDKFKHNLTQFGFSVASTADNFVTQQELLYGTFTRSSSASEQYSSSTLPYYAWPSGVTADNASIAIIGAGISGAATAYSLARRGFNVDIYDKQAEVAAEASGNWQGILYGSWSKFGGARMELSCNAYSYSHKLIQQLLANTHNYHQCGLIQLNHNLTQAKRNSELLSSNLPPEFVRAVSCEEIEALCNTPIHGEASGIYFPSGLWLHPKAFIQALINQAGISFFPNCQIDDLIYHDHQWQLVKNGVVIKRYSQVVVCNAYSATHFTPLSKLPLTKIRGQVTTVNRTSPLTSIICGDGYIAPNFNQAYTLGATFQPKDDDATVHPEDNVTNLNRFNHLLPEVFAGIQEDAVTGRANFRTSSRDYLPLVGPIAQWEEFRAVYHKLQHNRHALLTANCPYLPGLYLNLAHGAKGMLTAPYCGELIADYITGSQLAASEELRMALHPNRVYVKALYRKQQL
jgi:tRNA 5-methylaminomethyl-2-thiouridine biosynthesis bifunctional protein